MSWVRPQRGLAAFVLVVCLALAGCWNNVGHRLDLPPATLLDAALDAHHRGDDRAARTLLRRVAEEHEDSPEASVARTLLLAIPPTDQGLLRPASRE